MIYICLLRGINVSGKNIIKMNDLKILFEELTFQNVVTYIQSGNIVFTSTETNKKILEKIIQENIKEKFALNIPVMIMTKDYLAEIFNKNPFSATKNTDFLHFTFLSKKIENIDENTDENKNHANIIEKKSENEDIFIAENVVYLHCPDGYGNTKLTNTFLENKLKITATTRNWKTTNEILKIAEKK